jgi:hypothetical protein
VTLKLKFHSIYTSKRFNLNLLLAVSLGLVADRRSFLADSPLLLADNSTLLADNQLYWRIINFTGA